MDPAVLEAVLDFSEPRRIRSYGREALVDYALSGWEYWPEGWPRQAELAFGTGLI